MPFVKLDVGILDSTLWIEKDQRDVFLTALLMAEPREFKEPLQQIEVDSMALTGFKAPPGWYGFVAAAGGGIVRRSLTEHFSGMKALRALGSPDVESRSKDFEGRRLIRIDGGYAILNFMAYRDRDYGAAERMRRMRERRKEATLRRDSDAVHRNDTQAEAEAEAEALPTRGNAGKAPPSAGANGEFMLATWLGEEMGLALSRSDLPLIADVIRLEAKARGEPAEIAVQFLRTSALEARGRGEAVTVWWFKDRKFAGGVKNGHTGKGDANYAVLQRSLAEDQNCADRDGDFPPGDDGRVSLKTLLIAPVV